MNYYNGKSCLVMLMGVALLLPVRARGMSSAHYSLKGSVASGGGTTKASSSESYSLGGMSGQSLFTPAANSDTEQYCVKPFTLVTVASVPPTVVTLRDGAMTSDNLLAVSGMVSVSPAPKSLTVKGEAVSWDSAGTYSTVVKLSPGGNVIQVTAIDQNNKATGVSRTIFLNVDAPKVQFTSPPPTGKMYTTQELTLNGTMDSDAVVTVKLNGVARTVSSAGGTFSTTLSGLTVGDNSVVATVTRDGLSSSAVMRLVGMSALHSGDVNSDGVVDIVDVLQALHHVVRSAPLDAAAVVRCDVAPIVRGVSTPDGICDMADVLWMLRRTVGLN